MKSVRMLSIIVDHSRKAILSNDVTELNDAAFYGCSSLEKVKLSEKLADKLGDLISEDAEEEC